MSLKNQELVDYLRECGVCQLCQLRYLKTRGNEYQDVQLTFDKLNVKNICETDGAIAKKRRRNVCPACLDLFSEEFRHQLIQEILALQIDAFESKQIVIAISLPMVLQVRTLSMWYALLNKFEHRNISKTEVPDVPLKEAIKLILNPIICKKLNSTYDVNGVMININLEHAEETEQAQEMLKLIKAVYADMPNGKGGKLEISRGVLENLCTPVKIPQKLFESYFPVPASIPNQALRLKELTLTGPTVFVAGRYCKISRTLSHTPWVLHGVRKMEDSIEEVLIRNIAPYFGANSANVTFMSSGREDVDVRCLGKGRPFALEIPDARRITLSRSEAQCMQHKIDTSGCVTVRDLQIITREDLVHIKTGEEKKKKYYRALCVLEQPATVQLMQKLQLPEGFEVQQKTPIRVLHRRPLLTRARRIYSLKARVQPDNKCVLVLDIVTQAGTYIKELVFGEFGRTTPSIAGIIEQRIDIQALDVVGIDLDWPPEIENIKQ